MEEGAEDQSANLTAEETAMNVTTSSIARSEREVTTATPEVKKMQEEVKKEQKKAETPKIEEVDFSQNKSISIEGKVITPSSMSDLL